MEKSAEKESSRRSWPWKRKSNDKISAAPDLGTSPNSSKLFDDNQRWDYHHQNVSSQAPQPPTPKEQAKNSSDRHDRNRVAVEEGRNQWLQSEERAKLLNEKLISALADITTKDNLVKQHVKVAEEAVTGWEKAEAEAVALKAQLDVALQQKLATEDRVAHLDGALKECMKQLRHVREEQEQRIHETLVKKTREYDKLRMEMETKLAESSQLLEQSRSELLESRAEVTAVSHALQDRLRIIAEISEAKGRAETDIKVLQVRLETVEKENSQLKYEVHVLNKELDIRSQEREYERKAVDMASKQHLESVKKIAKLEEECNRLRLLVRKKLPGPAAIQRMRMEVEGLGRDSADKRRRSLSRSVSNLDPTAANEAMQENVHEAGGHSREAQLLAERVVSMDEEMKMLKEALAQRNGELQSARLMCSKTATQLSVVEDELKRTKQQNGALRSAKSANGSPSEGVTSRNEGSETWAIALVAELDHFKNGKSRPNSMSGGRRDSQNFELMDDFAEMERLALSEAITEPENTTKELSGVADLSALLPEPTVKQVKELEESLEMKTQDLETANGICQDLKSKLAAAEEQLKELRSRSSAAETSLVNLQDQLDQMTASQHEQDISGNSSRIAHKGLSGYTMKDILVRAKRSGQVGLASEASSSEGELIEEHASISDAESKASAVHSELSISIDKIVHIIEGFARATGRDFTPSSSGRRDSRTNEISLQLQWENLDLGNIMRNLVLVSNNFLLGKSDIVDFLMELGTALDHILAVNPSTSDGHLATLGITTAHEEVTKIKDKAQEELERMREQFARVNAELKRLKTEKVEIQNHLEEANSEVENLKAQLHKGEQFTVDDHTVHHQTLRDTCSQQGGDSPDAKGRKEDELIEEELMVLSSSNPALRAASGELNKLHDKVAALEIELHGERQRHQSVVGKLEDLEQQVQRGGLAVSSEMSGVSHGDLSSHSTSEEDEDTKSQKLCIGDAMKHERQEREIAAAALVECQRTILALGKQLKGMGTAPQTREAPLNSSMDSVTSMEKMTENMEYLRWQTEATDPDGPPLGSPWTSPGPRRAHRSPSPAHARRVSNSNGLYPHSTQADPSFYARAEKGNMLDYSPRPSSPTRSEFSGQQCLTSVPSSPSRTWSFKSRANGGAKAMNGEAQTDEISTAEKPRSSSSFSRFYSRSRSGSLSGSSG